MSEQDGEKIRQELTEYLARMRNIRAEKSAECVKLLEDALLLQKRYVDAEKTPRIYKRLKRILARLVTLNEHIDNITCEIRILGEPSCRQDLTHLLHLLPK